MDITNILLASLWAFLVSVFAIPSIIDVAHLKKLLDEPNNRTVHYELTPRLGGLAIFAGFVSAVTIFGKLENGIQEIMAGAIIILFIGLKDDIVTVSAFKKFFVQVLASGIVMFMADIRIRHFQGFMGYYEIDDGMSYAFTFLVIIGITNAVNLVDGLDGLAGTIVCIVAAVFGFYFLYRGGDGYIGYAVVAFSLVGAIIGFLRYNIHNAAIFMGDTGSLVSGFIIAILAIQFIEMKTVTSSHAIAVAALIIPVWDTCRVFFRRIVSGKSPFAPDKHHIHHWLVGFGLSQIATVIVLAVINILIVLAVIFLANEGNNKLLLGIITFCVLSSLILEFFARKKNLVADGQAKP